MSRIMVTGANGFIGSHLLKALSNRHQLYGLIRDSKQAQKIANVNWIEHDLTKQFDHQELPKKLDIVIHLAQSRMYRDFPDGGSDIFDVNVRSTFNLLEYSRIIGVDKFIYASSGGVYGYSYEKFVETDPVSPLNFYLSSKYMAELLIANYHHYLTTIVLRLFFVYGEGQKNMLIPGLLNKIRNGEKITVLGNPGLRINPINVDDAVRVFEAAIKNTTSGLFNIAGDDIVSITDLIWLMEKVVGKKALVEYQESNLSGDLIGSNVQMKRVLNVHPRIPLSEGIIRTADSIRSG